MLRTWLIWLRKENTGTILHFVISVQMATDALKRIRIFSVVNSCVEIVVCRMMQIAMHGMVIRGVKLRWNIIGGVVEA
jgi:hypothetical protein